MYNVLYQLLFTIEQENPLIFYVFLALIAAGVGLTYVYKAEVGLLATIFMSGMFFYIGMLQPYSDIVFIASVAVLAASLLRSTNIPRSISNLRSWLYLRRRSSRSKK